MKLIQFSAGQGPSECALAVKLGVRRFIEDAEKLGLEVDIVEQEAGEVKGTFKSVLLMLKTNAVNTAQQQFLEQWQGSIQWICRSPYRPKHGRKNWFFNVMLWESDESQPLNTSDVEIKTCRSSGAGGQHVNTTDSAVQLLHKPTGLSVKVQTERSQHQNKRLAFALLKHKIKTLESQQNEVLKGHLRLQHHQVERGRAVRVFVGERFQERG